MMKQSKALMRAFHSIIEKDVGKLINSLHSGGTEYLTELTPQELETWKTISLTLQQSDVLRKAVESTGRLIVFGILSIIDGVSYVADSDVPDLALVNRETREDIADQFLHDEFVEQRMD
jgi:hypothetical protein